MLIIDRRRQGTVIAPSAQRCPGSGPVHLTCGSRMTQADYHDGMTAPQHRVHLADRVQRPEAWAFAAGADVADIKAAVEQLPSAIRQEILEYTEPVFGEIMAGGATLATREDAQALEQRVMEGLRALDGKLERRFSGLESRLDQVLAALAKTDG